MRKTCGKANSRQARPSLAGVARGVSAHQGVVEGVTVPQGVAQSRPAQVQAQAQQQQMFLGMYFPLVVQLTQYRVGHGYAVEGGLSEPSSPDRVAEEAWSYADAAMKRLLVPVEKNAPPKEV